MIAPCVCQDFKLKIMKTKTTIEDLNQEDLVNLFSSAIYGSKYLSVYYEADVDYDDDDCHEDIIAKILLNGGEVCIVDGYADGIHHGNLSYEFDEDDNAVYHVRYIDIRRGLEKAANGTFNLREDVGADFADRNEAFGKRSFNAFAYDDRDWDIITADCLMQIILFDEIVYG